MALKLKNGRKNDTFARLWSSYNFSRLPHEHQKLKNAMAGQLNEVRNRIKSTQSTQQLTKAMKMVSAAKLRRAQDAITQMRPYTRKLQEMLSNIIGSLDGDMNLALAETRPVNNVLFIVITSDRGLCGGYICQLSKISQDNNCRKIRE